MAVPFFVIASAAKQSSGERSALTQRQIMDCRVAFGSSQ